MAVVLSQISFLKFFVFFLKRMLIYFEREERERERERERASAKAGVGRERGE